MASSYDKKHPKTCPKCHGTQKMERKYKGTIKLVPCTYRPKTRRSWPNKVKVSYFTISKRTGKPRPDYNRHFIDFWALYAPSELKDQLVAEWEPFNDTKHRCDFMIKLGRVVVEIEGGTFKHNGGRHSTEPDMHKYNRLGCMDYVVLRYKPDMIMRDPQAAIQEIASACYRRYPA